MKRKLQKIAYIIILTLIGIALPCSSALAISNPDTIEFTSATSPMYKVFESVLEDGDMLFIAEGYVYYASEPTDYTAKEAFLFEILNTGGNTTLLSRPIEQYGDRPISIYQTANQVSSLGLVSGSAYIMRITGNPLIFASQTGNTVTVTLGSEDYVDYSDGADSTTPTDNHLRNFCILVALNMELEDTPTDDYIDFLQGYSYLSNTGGSLFIEGVPNLYNMCPILFRYGVERLSTDEPESTGAYASSITPLGKWGQLTADGLTNIGVYLGINQALAGSVVLFLLVILLSVYIYSRTQSGITVLLMVCTTPFVGGFLGLMPMAMAFIFIIVIVVLMGYYFFSRGAL